MKALMITGGILLLLLLLLLSPVSLDVAYREGGFSARLRYLFFRFDLISRKAKRGKRGKPEKQKKPEQAAGEQKTKNTAHTVMEMVRCSRRGLDILRRHLIFSRVKVLISVGGEDAHKTAVTYGRINAAAAVALDILRSLFVLKKTTVGIAPDFLRTQTRWDVSLRVGIRPLFAMAGGVNILLRLMRLSKHGKKKSQQIKGGKAA